MCNNRAIDSKKLRSLKFIDLGIQEKKRHMNEITQSLEILSKFILNHKNFFTLVAKAASGH
jgi:hypothetical protein